MENTQNTQPEVVQEGGVSNNKKYAIIAIISVVVLLALFAGGYFLVKYYKGKTPTAGEEVKKPKIISGTLLVSMLPNDVEGGIPLAYSIDASSSSITPIYQETMKSDNLYISHASLSANKNFYITGGIPMDASPENAGNSMSLYSGNFGGVFAGIKSENIVAKFGDAADSKGLMFRGPSIGNHGGVLYAAAPKDTKEINFNWEIHYNALQQDVIVAYGLSPKWVSSNEFVYLTKKGIRMHNISSGLDTVVDVLVGKYGKPFPLQTNMTLGVSDDGKQLAFTNPEGATIYLFSRDGERFVLKKSFDAFGFWPTFSPDGQILALQTIDNIERKDINPMPSIIFFDIEQEKPQLLDKKIELGNYHNDVLFINDWY